MIKLANHIKRIEISSLWSGHKHIVWDLRPDVNVLSGHNGAGKSTISTASYSICAPCLPPATYRATHALE